MPEYCVNIPPGAPVIARLGPCAGHGRRPVTASIAWTKPASSPANSTVLDPASGTTNGTTGEREWATPDELGRHPARPATRRRRCRA